MRTSRYRDPANTQPVNVTQLLTLADETLTDRYADVVAHADLGITGHDDRTGQ